MSEERDFDLKCDDCGVTSSDVVDTVCPYAYEIYEDRVDCVLCPGCHHERSMDI